MSTLVDSEIFLVYSTKTVNQLILVTPDAGKSFQLLTEKFCHTYLAVKFQKTQCASNPLTKTFKVSEKRINTNKIKER